MGTTNPHKQDQTPPAQEETTPLPAEENIQRSRSRENLIVRKPKKKRQKKHLR